MDPQNWRPDWIFAITTLLIRFFGIFIVLAVLQIIMHISGFFFRRWAEREVQETAQPPSPLPPMQTLAFVEDENFKLDETLKRNETRERELAAVIGTAISLYESEEPEPEKPTLLETKRPIVKPSDWTMIGRLSQLQSRISPKRG